MSDIISKLTQPEAAILLGMVKRNVFSRYNLEIPLTSNEVTLAYGALAAKRIIGLSKEPGATGVAIINSEVRDYFVELALEPNPRLHTFALGAPTFR